MLNRETIRVTYIADVLEWKIELSRQRRRLPMCKDVHLFVYLPCENLPPEAIAKEFNLEIDNRTRGTVLKMCDQQKEGAGTRVYGQELNTLNPLSDTRLSSGTQLRDELN